MAILGGYWPILVYFLPVVAVVSPSSLGGILLALPQILPFARYWKKSVRAGKKVDRNLGRLPWWKLKDLFWPTNSVALTSGVHYPEVAMYLGIAPVFIFHASWWWVPLIYSLLTVLSFVPTIQRIGARGILLLTLSICLLSSQALPSILDNQTISLVVLQAFLLLRNASIYPSFPFSQWWGKPSKVYPKADYTGYLENRKINDYKGAFSLRAA